MGGKEAMRELLAIDPHTKVIMAWVILMIQ